MKKSKTNNGKTFWLGLMLIAGTIPATAQEKLEIQITIRDGVVQTIEVDRDIEELGLGGSGLTSITLPEGLANLKSLSLRFNRLTSLILPEGLTSLEVLHLRDNELTSLTLPNGLTNLKSLNLRNNQLTSLTLPDGLTNLEYLDLDSNRLTSLTLPEGLTNLEVLNLWGNHLTSLTLPNGLTSLEVLHLTRNELTNLTLPEGLTSLEKLNLALNELTSLTLPEGLTSLTSLVLTGNKQLRSLTLAQDTSERFAGINKIRGLVYNLGVEVVGLLSETPEIFLKEVILPKRLDGKVFFYVTKRHPGSSPDTFDVSDNLEFIFLEDLRSPRITRAGDALEITWAVGVLQTAAGIEGPWKDVNASSPLRIFPRPSLPAEFFRVRAE